MGNIFDKTTWKGLASAVIGWGLLFAVSASVKAEQISLVTSHSETRLLMLLRDEVSEQQLSLNAVFIDQEQLKSELFRSRNANSLPDVLIVPPDISNIDKLHVEALPVDWFSDELDPSIAQQVPAVASRHAIPFVVGNHLMQFYNKAMVDAPVEDWNALAASYAEPIFSWSYNEMYWFAPFVLSHGVKFLHNGESYLDSPAMVAGLEYYKSLESRGVVNASCNYTCSVERFARGDLPYHINGTWAIDQLRGYLGDNLGVALLPSFDGVPMRSYYSAYVVVFPALGRHSPAKRAALKAFAQHIQSADFQVQLLQQGFQMPVNTVARAQFLNSDVAFHTVFVKQLDRSVLMPDDPAMVIVWDAMSRGFVRFNGGVLNAPAAARYMDRTFERFNRH